jgi:hypothetical protein
MRAHGAAAGLVPRRTATSTDLDTGRKRRGSSTITPTCQCGAVGELRRCWANSGIAWRCPRCLKVLSAWLPHPWLVAAGINVLDLPDWSAPARDDRQGGLAL